MGNKEDWEEIQKWVENEEIRKKNTFKIDIDKIDIEKKAKRMNIVTGFLNSILKTTKIGFLLIIAIVVFCAFTFANVGFSNMRTSFNADITSIERQHNIKMKIISEDTDENGNGSYEMALKKKQDICFKAVKKRRKFNR
ncbi:MAG: hypothetical protein HFJ50_05915 [Clostridia bacterium]|jgi:hypothetical protein|nr:hypothetical protein [Clostridia bacterium]